MSTPRKPLGEAEFNQLFHTYHKPVFLYLRTLLARRGHPPDPHLVEDLTQEAFTILWEKQESFLASPNPSAGCTSLLPTWPGTSCAPSSGGPPAWPRWIRNFWRPSPTPAPWRRACCTWRAWWLRRSWDLLRRVYLEGYSYEELAQELGTKPNTLASRVSRIKAKFRKKFPGFGTFFAGWVQGIPSPRT